MGTDEREPPTEPYTAGSGGELGPRAGTIVTDDPTSAAGPYAIGEVIGRGGMGEVLLAHDRRIGRDVALKRLPLAAPSDEERRWFLREARIQARLEHPAIVPVYEMGRDQTGRPFFTMKRIAGDTLARLIDGGDVSTQKLLRAFAEVCRAIDYAHSRGVVHRDLKPSNIVLGEFGEVYVIDWGIARVVSDARDSVEMADIDTIQAAPAAETVGTPGYVSPEQLHAPNVDRPSDVYSLGAILFEILTGELLHDRGNAKHSTMSGETVLSPAQRTDRTVPPELDALTVSMLASKPSVRPTVRRCAELVEEYLDGDRDVARRRVMAHDLVALARDAMREGRAGDAMRAAGRALALDPEMTEAGQLVSHLMLQAPSDASPEVREQLAVSDDAAVREHARAATPGYVMIASFLPLIAMNGVKSWPVVLGLFALALVMTVAAWDLAKRPRKSFVHWVVYAIGNALILAFIDRIASPLLAVPALVSFITGSVVTYPPFLTRKWLLIGIMLTGWLAPLALEVVDVLPATWTIDERGFVIFGDAITLLGIPAIATVVLAGVATVLMAGLQSSRVGRASRQAHHQLVLQAHQLRALLPS
jgi:serine/threonine-protein kinase